MLLQVELMFRRAQSTLMARKDVKRQLVAEAEHLTLDIELPSCHEVKSKLLAKFINACLHFFCKKQNVELKAEMAITQTNKEVN